MTVYIAHPVSRAPGPEDNAALASLMVEGAGLLHPARSFRHGVASSQMSRVRRILGDIAPRRQGDGGPMGPNWSPGPWLVARASEVWACRPDDPDVQTDIGIAEHHGIAVRRISDIEERLLLSASVSARRRKHKADMASIIDKVLRDVIQRADFLGVRAVVRGASANGSIMDMQGIDYERIAGRVNGGQAIPNAVQETGLRVARASGIMRRAKLTLTERKALHLREIEERSYRQVALGLGWDDTSAAEKRAERLIRRSLSRLRSALRMQSAEIVRDREEITR